MKYLSIIISLIFMISTANILFNISIISSMLLSAFMLIGLYSFRVFDLKMIKSFNEIIVRSALGGGLFAIFLVVLYIAFKSYIDKVNVMYFYFLQTIAITLIQVLFIKYYVKRLKPKLTFVIGNKSDFMNILNEIKSVSYEKYVFKAFYENKNDINLSEFLESNKEINTILICDATLEKKLKAQIIYLKRKNIIVEYLPDICEKILKRIPVEVIDKFVEYYQIEFFKIIESPDKRMLDIFISLIFLIIFSPVFVLISILIVFEDRLPLIFKQDRIGYQNNVYTIHKFRTMKLNDRENARFANTEQQRILKTGRLLRAFRLDEVLQFYDILTGKMSVIGPRPEQLDFVKTFEELIPFYVFRHTIKPGLTGWAQINYKYSSTIEETKMKFSYDLYYIKNRNFLFDLEILLKTIETVLFRRGAV